MALQKKEPILAHGLTARQKEEVKLRKLSRDIEMIPANKRDQLKDKHFKEDYAEVMIPMHNRFLYYVAMENRLFNTSNGERQSAPILQTFDKETWKTFSNTDVFKTYTSEIVHNPELEDPKAPLVTLQYTLTDEEIEAARIEAEMKAKDEEIETLKKGTASPEPGMAVVREKGREIIVDTKSTEAAAPVTPMPTASAPAIAPAVEVAEPNTAAEPTPANVPAPEPEQGEPEQGEITEAAIDAITDAAQARAMLADLTASSVPGNLGLDKAKARIKDFLGFTTPTE